MRRDLYCRRLVSQSGRTDLYRSEFRTERHLESAAILGDAYFWLALLWRGIQLLLSGHSRVINITRS